MADQVINIKFTDPEIITGYVDPTTDPMTSALYNSDATIGASWIRITKASIFLIVIGSLCYFAVEASK